MSERRPGTGRRLRRSARKFRVRAGCHYGAVFGPHDTQMKETNMIPSEKGHATGMLTRRGFTCLMAFTLATGLSALAPADASAQASGAAQKIADHFASVKTMIGEFV